MNGPGRKKRRKSKRNPYGKGQPGKILTDYAPKLHQKGRTLMGTYDRTHGEGKRLSDEKSALRDQSVPSSGLLSNKELADQEREYVKKHRSQFMKEMFEDNGE